MGIKLRYWAAGLAAVCALITVLFLPLGVGSRGRQPGRPISPIERAESSIDDLQRRVARLELMEAFQTNLDQVPPVFADLPEPELEELELNRYRYVADEQRRFELAVRYLQSARTLYRQVADRVERLAPNEDGVVVGFVKSEFAQGGIYVGRTQRGRGFCVFVTGSLYGVDYRSREGVLALGPCDYFRRFGMPGGRVGDWIQSGADALFDPWADDESVRSAAVNRLADIASELIDFGAERFGGNIVYQRLRNEGFFEMERCRGGVTRSCIAAYFEMKGATRDPGILGNRSGQPMSLFPGSRDLLRDLETEFGAERIGDFWRSDLPVVEAFAAAFGVPAEEWLHNWTVTRFGSRYAGPGMPLASWGYTILILGLFAGLAGWRAKRRDVDMAPTSLGSNLS